MSSIDSYKQKITELYDKLENTQMSHEEKQLTLDEIENLKHEIEKSSKSEQLIIKGNGAKIKDRKVESRSSYISDNRVMI